MSIQPIPAKSYSYAHLLAGQTLKVINYHGTQQIDIWAFSQPPSVQNGARRRSHHHHHGPNNPIHSSPIISPTAFHPALGFSYLSTTQTRTALIKLLPSIGDAFYDNHREPLLLITEDTSGGAHDLLLAACDQKRYVQMGATSHHENCKDNLSYALNAAVKEFEHSMKFFNPDAGFSETVKALHSVTSLISPDSGWLPDPVKLFMNWPVEALGDGAGGAFGLAPPICPPGGYISLRAERECVVVMCACCMDMLGDTGYETKGAEFEVLAAENY